MLINIFGPLRYANCGDDENSQAEGTSEGAVGYSRLADSTNNPTNTTNNNHQSAHPHYENIYESIDQYAAAVAAPAVSTENNYANNATASTSGQSIQQTPPTQQLNSNVVIAPPGTSRSIPVQSANGGAHRNPIYRNEIYSDRTGGYDVPRQMFRPQNYSTNGATGTTTKRRANLHLDLNPNRPRYTTASRPHRQRSFDDTESNYYNNFRYENIYEQIHEEPIYRNFSSSAGSANAGGGVGHTNRMYGRLGVIGHGIGRIERHLSSSCGNIDHYNLGGHYAVLGHSHLGTVGHIRLNAGAAPSAGGTTKDSNGAVKSLNFFSCLGRENSQSMNNIHRAANAAAAPSAERQTNMAAPTTATSILRPATGAIPKTPKLKKSSATSQPSNDDSETESTTTNTHDSSLNRISKSSLQWLLVNKWLPMWIGQEPDYNILDFNFMFSRNCGGCGDTFNRQQSVVRFNGHAEMRARPDQGVARRQFANGSTGGSLRPMRLNHSLSRLRECEHGAVLRRDGSLDERNRQHRENPYDRDRYREDYYERLARQRAERARETDPFRNWELNTENNSFRPAGQRDIRRITDGTYPAPVAGTSAGNMQRQAKEPAKTGSSKTMERLVNPRLDSRTESGNESPSPDLGGRRYSDNTEDDQHNDDDVRDIDED